MEEQKNQTVMNTDAEKNAAPENKKGSGSKIQLIIAAVVLVLAALVYLFIRLDTETTGKIRDITLIIFALESVVTAVAVVVLCVQLAKFVSFLKYEIEPILHTTDKTFKKISGTVSFLSENAVKPAMDAASTVSGIRNAADGILSVFKKP